MKIQFLGTGAADWGVSARNRKDYRRYCSALIDGTLHIDPVPCVPDAAKTFGLDLSEVRYILCTHRHSDHYNAGTAALLEQTGAQFISFSQVGTRDVNGYSIEAVKGNHGTGLESLLYVIVDGAHRIFYGLDGAWLLYDEVEAIKRKWVDLAVLDATIGDVPGDYRIFEHNNLIMVEEMKKTLEPYIGRFVISHMALTLHTDHQTLERRMAQKGIETAFDGMEICLE